MAYATVTSPYDLGDEAQTIAQLRRSLHRGTEVTRYNRTWHMGSWSTRWRDDTAVGRIGFERQIGNADLWDPKTNDFTRTAVMEGRTAPFALHFPTQRVAFQLRGGYIKRTSFTQAFQALLNAAVEEDLWRVEPLLDHESFDAWRARVDRITMMRFKLERPNPNYAGDQRVEQLIEESRSSMVRMVLSSDDPDGLNIDDEFIQEAIDHAAVREYGEMVVEGQAGDTITRYYSQEDAAPPERQIRLGPRVLDVPPGTLAEAAAEGPPMPGEEDG